MANQVFTADEAKRLGLSDKAIADLSAKEISQQKELLVAMNKADEDNQTRSGKGTRLKVSRTRGKNPKIVSYEAFDEEQPATLPISAAEFMELTKTTDEKVFVGYLIDGFNSAQYSAASDVLSEYVEANWPPELVRAFKLAVNNYVTGAGVQVEDAVSILKPAFQKNFEAKLAAASAA